MELYRRLRPKRLEDVVGQDATVKELLTRHASGKLPHASLLSGPSGVGKTTIVRCLRRLLGCRESDYCEINAASSRGIDTVREVESHMNLAPMFGKCRMWAWDEAHKVSSDAQHSMLKLLEDVPKHVYFVLCTTDPTKLIPTIRNRCTHLALKPLTDGNLEKLILSAAENEGSKISQEVVGKIVEVSLGSARRALVLLEQVLQASTEEEQIRIVMQSTDGGRQAIDLARLLFKGAKWAEIAALLREIKDDPEDVRRLVLGYAGSVLEKGVLNPRAFLILEVFERAFYESGRPGLVRACAEVAREKL